MATHPEKLNTAAIRLAESLEKEARAYAASIDLGFSEWVRTLIVRELEGKKNEYRKLHAIFGHSDE